MRAATVAPKGALPKLKLNLPPPKSPFRAYLPTSPCPSQCPCPSPAAPVRQREKTQPLEKTEERLPELDSAARTAVLLAPPPSASASPMPAPAATPTRHIDPQLAAELVEKAAFWGDGTRGVARLRFTGRARSGLANATITLEHDGDATHLRVEGVDDGDLERLRERLASRGVTISGET